ncbi:hypothetical protein [Spirosoma linguale]
MRFSFLLVLLSTYPAWSQSSDSTATADLPTKSNFRSSTMVELGYGYAYTRLPNMRAFFKSNQIKENYGLDNFVTVGFGYRRQRFKGSLYASYGIDQNSRTSGNTGQASLVARRQNFSGAVLFVGYDLANTRNQRVFLNAGVGGIRYEYNVFRTTNQAVPFQTILQNNTSGSIPSLFLTSSYWDVNIEVSQREKHRHALQWVSRFGYRRGFTADAWQSDAYQLIDAPSDRVSQFYAQFSLYISRNYMARQKR